MALKWRRLAIWGVLVLALAGGLAFAFWPRPVPVDLVRIAPRPMTVTIDEEGEARVRDIFVLSAPVGGRLRRIEMDVGDAVVADETEVAQIEPADPGFLDVRSEGEADAALRAAESALELARAELDQAKAELDFSAAELERARELIRRETISQRALDEAERAFKTRKAAVATAEARLEMRRFEVEQARARLVSPVQTQILHGRCVCIPIVAPVGGRILRVLRESAGVVQAGDPLVEIGDPRDLEIVADLLSSDAIRVEPGQKVVIDDWGGPQPLSGVVRRVEPYGFTKVSALGIEEQRVNVVVDLSDPPESWARLGHGYRVEIRVVLWETGRALTVPLTALFRDGERWAVFVAEDGVARLRHVEVGHRDGLSAEVRGGLSEGEEVLVHPGDRVAAGTAVTARSVAGESGR